MNIPRQRTPSLLEQQSKIDELLASATRNHARAREYEDKANKRYAKLREEELHILKMRAKAGNPQSQIILNRYLKGDVAGFVNIVDTRAANDPKWKGYVENQKFYLRLANGDNQMAQTLIQRAQAHT